MTEQEAIEKIKDLSDRGYPTLRTAKEIAIKALEEVQQCREIGTVKECRKSLKEENVLKFYYCESEDDYYIGKRVGNFYYARYGKTGFTWFMSRYLPWGEHVVNPETAWKEYTYPSEPKEIPFTEWMEGFVRKHMNDGWISVEERLPEEGAGDGELIITDKDGRIWSGIYYGITEEIDEEPCFHKWDEEISHCYKRDVIAWGPLAEP